MPLDVTTVFSSAARTASANSDAVGISDHAGNIAIVASVSAVSGTSPTLDLAVQWSADGGTTWAAADGTADTFAQITTAVNRTKSFTVKGTHYRVAATIAGTTPSFTFSATGVEVA